MIQKLIGKLFPGIHHQSTDDPTPKEMSDRVTKYLKSYRPGKDKTDDNLLIDVLTDLRHWADINDVDFDEALQASEAYHLFESAPCG